MYTNNVMEDVDRLNSTRYEIWRLQMDADRRSIKKQLLTKEEFRHYINLTNTQEFKDPIRDSKKPITQDDINEMKIDLVDFARGIEV